MKSHAYAPRTAVVLFLLPLVLSACAGESGPDARAAEEVDQRLLNVRVLEVSRSDLVETVPLTGRLDARRATDVSTEESGVVQSLPVAKGERAREGQVIVSLDRRVLDAERRSSQAAVTLRAYNEERTRSLLEANSVSKQEMLLAVTELEQAQEAARIAELRYERAAIKAPFDGLVADHYVEVGQLVNPGERVARVVDPFHLELVGSLTEREIHAVRLGSPAQVTVEGTTGSIDAEVTFVGVEADPLNGKFPVELTVDNADLRLRAGVIGRARVVKEVHRDVIAIPRDAVVRSNDGESVFVVEGDRVRAQPVQLGVGQGLMVVVEHGLSGGERIVVRGQRLLQPDGRIEIQEVATARDGSIATDPLEVREAGHPGAEQESGGGPSERLTASPVEGDR